MRLRSALALAVAALAVWGVLRAQRPFKEYPGTEYENFPLPADYQEKTEWTRARLKYPGVHSESNLARSMAFSRKVAAHASSASGRSAVCTAKLRSGPS